MENTDEKKTNTKSTTNGLSSFYFFTNNTMWESKWFKDYETATRWIEEKRNKYQCVLVIVENGYEVEYKRLRKVY